MLPGTSTSSPKCSDQLVTCNSSILLTAHAQYLQGFILQSTDKQRPDNLLKQYTRKINRLTMHTFSHRIESMCEELEEKMIEDEDGAFTLQRRSGLSDRC